MPTALRITTEKITLVCPDGEVMNKYLLVHPCEDPDTKEIAGKIIVAGQNPMMTAVVVQVAQDCEFAWEIGQLVYIPGGDACPALPINLKHDRFVLVQEIYVPYRLPKAQVESLGVSAVTLRATAEPAIERGTPEAARAMADAVKVVRG